MPSEQAIALFTNVFGYAPDPEALHAGECWQVERIDAALRHAKAEGVRLCERERDELSRDLEDVRKQLSRYKDQHRRDREYIDRLQKELGHGKGEVVI